MTQLVADDTTGPRRLQPSVLRSESFREYQIASPSCYKVTLKSSQGTVSDSVRVTFVNHSLRSLKYWSRDVFAFLSIIISLWSFSCSWYVLLSLHLGGTQSTADHTSTYTHIYALLRQISLCSVFRFVECYVILALVASAFFSHLGLHI